MEDQNYTIKDIARMAGVSAGTVDRVLHNRGDVSEKSKEKVQKVLDEINYQPNVFAIGLAAKKKYVITCMIPHYNEHDYWHSVATGIERARQELRPFNVSVDYLYYTHGDRSSYQEACKTIENSDTDALLLAPNFREDTLPMLEYLKKKKIPFAFIDFDIQEAKPLIYIGQDSYKSGYIAAKILMRNYSEGQEIALFLNNNKENHPKTLCFRVFFFIVRGESSVILISPIGNLYGAIQSCYLNTFHVQSDSQTVLPVCLGTKSCLRTIGRHGR